MPGKHKEPFAEEGRRLRLFRKAEGFATAFAFAQAMGWPPSAVSQFESGKTRVTVNPALQLRKRFPGFDPVWLWDGDARGLSYDLRRRIDAEEAKEALSLGKGNDVLKYGGR